MRIDKTLIFFLFLILILKTNVVLSIFEGQIAEPIFNKKGDLIYIYKNIDGKIILANADKKEFFVLPFRKNVFSPLIKKDRNGKIWLIWEEWEKNQSKIFVGKLKKNKLISIHSVIKQEGFNYSSDLYFDVNNQPWLTWINWNNSQYKIFVSQIFLGKIWIISSFYFSSISSPKIIIDNNNQVWIFWSGKNIGEEEIYFRKFNQVDWLHIGRINIGNSYPNINPEIAIDKRGIIWVIWSGYDGHDYEIYCALWDGEKLIKRMKITDNLENDIFPSISILYEYIPVIVWSKSDKKGSKIYIKFFKDNNWSKEIKVSFSGFINNFPKIICKGEKIGLVWESGREIKTKILYFDQLRKLNYVYFLPYSVKIIYNPLLQENRYIGFGNSITYGYINHEPVPEKGYIPRLENILNDNFGGTEILNEGMPGELTQNGLSRIEEVIENDFARYLLLMEGTNDVIFNQISMDTTAFNLREMIKKCIEYGVFPSIATILPRKDWVWYFDFFRNRIFYLNNKIKQIAEEFSIPLVDQFNSFLNYPEEEGGWKSLLSEDGKHPNEKGYQVMAEEWFEEIKKFPFPPLNFNVKRVINEILFYKQEMNYLAWFDNPKIYDKSYIKGYKIYRKTEHEQTFKLIDIVCNKHEYLDKNIIPAKKYNYLISTLRKDGVEGPCVGPIKDY